MTAGVAVTVSNAPDGQPPAPHLKQHQLELTSLNALGGTTAKLSRAWDEHLKRHNTEVNVWDVNVAPGAQAVVGVVGLPEGPAAQAAETQKGNGRKKAT